MFNAFRLEPASRTANSTTRPPSRFIFCKSGCSHPVKGFLPAMHNSHLPKRYQTNLRWPAHPMAAIDPSKSIRMLISILANSPPQEKSFTRCLNNATPGFKLIEGIDLDLNGARLSPGDGASLDDENEIQFGSAKKRAHISFCSISTKTNKTEQNNERK